MKKLDKNKKFLNHTFFSKNRRGDDSTVTLIRGLIIGIVSLLIIIGFIVILNMKRTTNQQVCYDSVVKRSAGVLPAESIPLNCKTDYICLSQDGSCEKMTNPEIIKVKTKEEVYDVLANQMTDCWWMFGEGKLNYVGKTFNSNLYCSICSQVAFDDSLNNLFVVNPSTISRASAGIPETYSNFLIDKKNLYEYLSKTNISGKGISYLDYSFGLQSSKPISDALQTNNYQYGYIDLTKQYLVVMGIFSEVGIWKWVVVGVGTGVTVAAITILTSGIGTIPALISITSGVAGGVAGGGGGYLMGVIVKGSSDKEYLSPTIIEANSEEYNKLQCTDIKTLA